MVRNQPTAQTLRGKVEAYSGFLRTPHLKLQRGLRACFDLLSSLPLRPQESPKSLQRLPGPLTISWMLPIATWPQSGLTGMAAEAAPVEEMAIHTEAFQEVEVFPTELTQVLGSSLHRSQDTGSAGPKANCRGLPSHAALLHPFRLCGPGPGPTSWCSEGSAGDTLGSDTGGSSVCGVSSST